MEDRKEMNHKTRLDIVVTMSIPNQKITEGIKFFDLMPTKSDESKRIYSDFIEALQEEFSVMRINSTLGGDDFTVHDIQGIDHSLKSTLSRGRESATIDFEYGMLIEHNDSDEDFAFDDVPTTVSLSTIHKMIKERSSNHIHQHVETPTITHEGEEISLVVNHVGVNIVNT